MYTGNHGLCDACNLRGSEPYFPSCLAFKSLKNSGACKIISSDALTSCSMICKSSVAFAEFSRIFGIVYFRVIRCKKFEPSRSKSGHTAYLKSEKWKGLRRRAIDRADFKCERCGSAVNLEVHHLTYKRFGHEELDDLVVLCNSCHNQIHQKDKEAEE